MQAHFSVSPHLSSLSTFASCWDATTARRSAVRPTAAGLFSWVSADWLALHLQRHPSLPTGVGRQRAYTLIQKHGTIEEILKNIDTTKLVVPTDWKYKEARELFKNPEVAPASDFDVRRQAAKRGGCSGTAARSPPFPWVPTAQMGGARRGRPGGVYVPEARLCVRLVLGLLLLLLLLLPSLDRRPIPIPIHHAREDRIRKAAEKLAKSRTVRKRDWPLALG